MNGEPLRCTVVVTNPQGLHFRPATLFAEKARGFQSSVAVGCGNRRVDGKSGMDLIFLQALEGAELVLEVAGPDAAEALPALAALLADPGEAADADPSVPPKG